MSLDSADQQATVKIKEEPPDEEFIIDCNPWAIKQEPEENFNLELPLTTQLDTADSKSQQPPTIKHVIFPREYERTTPFHCKVCGKRFSGPLLLKSHAIIHERTTKCNMCGVRVLSKAMNTHVRKEHASSETFKCPKCYASFKIESNLMQHLKKHDVKFVYRIEK